MLSSTLKTLKAPIESVGCLILPFLSPWPTRSLASTCQVACSICIASAGLKNLTAHEFRAKLTTWPSFPGHSSPWIHAKCTFSIFIFPHQGWPTGYLFHAIPPCSILIRHPPKNPPPSETEFPMSFFFQTADLKDDLYKSHIQTPSCKPNQPHEIQMDRDPSAPGNCSHLQTAYREVCSNSHWNSEHPAVKSQGSVAN